MTENQEKIEKMEESSNAEGDDWVSVVPEPHFAVNTISGGGGKSVVDSRLLFRNKPPEVIHLEDNNNSKKLPPNDCTDYNYRSHGKTLIIELKAGGDQKCIPQSSQDTEPDLIQW